MNSIGSTIMHSLSDNSLHQADFEELREFVYQQTGINLGPEKKVMVEGRLRKRMRLLNLPTYHDYLQFLFSAHGIKSELDPFINAITTNKTDFFREEKHFVYLINCALPEISASRPRGYQQKQYSLWSAGCSSGEEPYTLGIVLSELAERDQAVTYSLCATDISTEMLQVASKGVYDFERVQDIPLPLLKKYFLRGKGSHEGYVRIDARLRELIKFYRINLLSIPKDFHAPFDVIFCRNVLIYFDRQTQRRVVQNMLEYLRPGGYLFIGHSETLSGLDLPLIRATSTVYKKID